MGGFIYCPRCPTRIRIAGVWIVGPMETDQSKRSVKCQVSRTASALLLLALCLGSVKRLRLPGDTGHSSTHHTR